MFTETLELMSAAAVKKAAFLRQGKGKYIVASGLAGFYVGLGIILIMVVGSMSTAAGSGFTKMLMGLSFSIALSLVIMAGSELFTGNNMIMMAGMLDKKVTIKDTLSVWLYSYIGNFMGSLLVGALFVYTGIAGTKTGEFILNAAGGKMNGDFSELLVKGILCNILVCLAVLCATKMKSESGKLIMIFLCLYAFITSGFEHSVANMTIFSMSLLLPHTEAISIMGMLNNLIPVTIGNIIGGAFFLAPSYFYIGKSN
jgi:nitrite transporter NirC